MIAVALVAVLILRMYLHYDTVHFKRYSR